MNDDLTLLREFARSNSESAFAEIVSRHINLVYSIALRQVRDAHLAEEITQAVFIILARKANSLGDKTILSGWLCRTVRHVSANALKMQMRRQRREQEAFMQTILTESASTETWNQIAPLLDNAMEKLGRKDHDALVLRFFENKNFTDVGAALGTSEDAAKMRVNRALEKLRKIFGKRGVSSTAAAIEETMSANSVQAAPATLAKSVTAMALAKGVAASVSTLTLVKAALKMMTWTKMKAAIVVGAGFLFIAGTVATASKLFLFSNDKDNYIQFVAEGTVTYATAPDPRGSYTDIKHFIVMRDGNRWKIRTITEKEEGTGRASRAKPFSVDMYYEMAFDGTNIYRFTQQDKNKILSNLPLNERDKWVFAEGDVEKADSPPGNDIYNIYPVWLAYCSRPYFKNLKGNKAVSPAFVMGDFIGEPIAPMQSPAKWSMEDNFFMKNVSWLSDGTFEVFMPDGKKTTQKYQPPYDIPFVWARFENLSWTNWNGISVPDKFKITVSRPDSTSKTVARFIDLYTITGTTEQIRNVENFSTVPRLTTKTHITDWRNNRKNQPARFVSTNFWDVTDAIRQAR